MKELLQLKDNYPFAPNFFCYLPNKQIVAHSGGWGLLAQEPRPCAFGYQLCTAQIGFMPNVLTIAPLGTNPSAGGST